jgi:acyl carrier protein
MSIETDLKEFIAAEVVADAAVGGVRVDEPLIRSGRVDSMGLLQILGFIQQRYSVDLASTGGPSDFETVTSLAAAVRRSRGEA